jgi:hypothetical protein
MIDTCDTPVFEYPVKHSYSGIEDIFPRDMSRDEFFKETEDIRVA